MTTNEQALVKSVLLHRFEEEIYHSDSFEHTGRKGMKWYQHIFGKVKDAAKKVKKTLFEPSDKLMDHIANAGPNKKQLEMREAARKEAAESRAKVGHLENDIDNPESRKAVLDEMDKHPAYRPRVDAFAWEVVHEAERQMGYVTKPVKIGEPKEPYKDSYSKKEVYAAHEKFVKSAEKLWAHMDHVYDSGDDSRAQRNKTHQLLTNTANDLYDSYRKLWRCPDAQEIMDSFSNNWHYSDDETLKWGADPYLYAQEFFSDIYELRPAALPINKRQGMEWKQSAEAELVHSIIQHHGVKNMKWYQHIFGDVEKTTEYYKKGNAGGDKPPKKLDQVKEKVKTKAVEATKRTVDTINKAKAKAEAVQAEHKRIRDNKKEADRMAKEEKEHIRRLHNDKAEEMTTEELKERNERMKLIKQYNDAYNAVYPDQKEANRKARRELVNTALKGLAEQAPKQVLDYAIGSTEYGKRKMKADIRKKELEVEGKVQENKGKELDIEKSRVNAETNRRSALQTAAKNKLNTATAKRDRHKDTLNRLTARADVLATKGKSSFLLNRAIKKEQKLLDSLEKAIQNDNEKYANKIEGIYKESIKTNLITLSKQGVPEQEVRVDKKGWFGKEKHTYKKTYQK